MDPYGDLDPQTEQLLNNVSKTSSLNRTTKMQQTVDRCVCGNQCFHLTFNIQHSTFNVVCSFPPTTSHHHCTKGRPNCKGHKSTETHKKTKHQTIELMSFLKMV